MKKLIFAVLLACASSAFAMETNRVNVSSFVAGATQTACIQATYLDKIFAGVSTSNAVLVVYNSTWTTTNTPVISSFTLTAGNFEDFNNLQVKGICYQAVTPTNGVNIIYKK